MDRISLNNINIYISYHDHEFDVEVKNKIQSYLTRPINALIQSEDYSVEQIEVWDKAQLLGGDNYKEITAKKLKAANIVILIMSGDYIASESYEETYIAVENNKNLGTWIIPIFARPFYSNPNEIYSKFVSLPSSKKYISKFKDEDNAYNEILTGIMNVIKSLCVLNKRESKINNYMKKIELDFSNEFLKNDLYVPIIGDVDGKIYDPINEYTELWMKDTAQNLLVVLGEYGTGKTTFCRNLAYDMAKRRLNGEKIPIPILFKLRYAKGKENLLDTFLEYLGDESELGASFFKEENFLERFHKGEFLIIFDGFDEMAHYSVLKKDYYIDEKKENFFQIESFLNKDSKGKIIVTCRDEYFRNESEKNKVLGSIYNKPNYKLIYIPLFNPKQIKTFLEKHIEENIAQHKIAEIIETTYDLMDLSKRAILLQLLVRYLPKVMENRKENITTTDLYEACIQEEILDRRITVKKRRKNFPKLTSELHKSIIVDLSKRLYVKNKLYFNLSEINIEDYLPLSPEEIEPYTTEILSFSFFIKESDDVYSISHKSFRDYLTAVGFVEEISQKEYKYFDKSKLTVEVSNFLIEILESKGAVNYNLINTLELIIDQSNALQENNYQIYLGGNAVSILNKINQLTIFDYDFKGKDYSNKVLCGADFSEANLQSANFSATDLTDADFSMANLEQSLFVNANCEHLLIEEGTEIRDCTFSKDGKQIIFGLASGDAQLISTNGFKPLNSFGKFKNGRYSNNRHTSSITCLDVTNDNKFLITGGYDNVIKVWDYQSKKLVSNYSRHSGLVRHLKCHPIKSVKYQDKFISADKNGQVILHDISENSYYTVMQLEDSIRALLHHPTKNIIFAGTNKGEIYISHYDDYKHQLTRLNGNHQKAVFGLTFSIEDNILYSCGWDGYVKSWDIDKGVFFDDIYQHPVSLRCINFNASDNVILVGDNDGEIFIIDLLERDASFLGKHELTIYKIDFHPSRNDIFISSGLDGSVKMWSLKNKKLVKDISSLGARLNCKGMNITGIKMTQDDIDYLLQRGAIMDNKKA